MKIAIIGASGLLGEGFLHILPNTNHKYIATHFTKNLYKQTILLDIKNYEQVMNFISKHEPDVVINTAAITNPEECERDHDLAYQTNVLGAKNIAKACKESGIYLITISTEYVFDGNKGQYSETDPSTPISFYGETKLQSEKVTLETNPKFCVARTSMLYGWSRTKSNLASTLIFNLRNRKKMDVIIDQIVSPSYNNDIADMLVEIAEKRLNGIYHVSGASIVTRYEFALTVAKVFGLDKSLIGKISFSDFDWKVKRPLNGGLIVDKIRNVLTRKPSTIEESLTRMKNDENYLQGNF